MKDCKRIRCCNCGTIFDTEDDLSDIVEISERDDAGVWHTTDRIFAGEADMDALREGEGKNMRYEIFKGCPECMGDEYLTDED